MYLLGAAGTAHSPEKAHQLCSLTSKTVSITLSGQVPFKDLFYFLSYSPAQLPLRRKGGLWCLLSSEWGNLGRDPGREETSGLGAFILSEGNGSQGPEELSQEA